MTNDDSYNIIRTLSHVSVMNGLSSQTSSYAWCLVRDKIGTTSYTQLGQQCRDQFCEDLLDDS